MPAVLYADRVDVIAPRTLDFLRTTDYDELLGQFPNVRDLPLDAEYPSDPADGAHESTLEPEVWAQLADAIVDGAVKGKVGRAHAIAYLELMDMGPAFDTWAHIDRLKPSRRERDRASNLVEEHDVQDELEGQLLRRVYARRSGRPSSFGVIDDASGTVRALADMTTWTEHAVRRSREALLATSVLRHLPTPRRRPWNEIREARHGLDLPLGRFRRAMARHASACELDPTIPEFEEYCHETWREIEQSLSELNAAVRESSFRELFIESTLNDRSVPVGAFGLALGVDWRAVLGATVGYTAYESAKALQEQRRQRRSVAASDLWFYREAERRLSS